MIIVTTIILAVIVLILLALLLFIIFNRERVVRWFSPSDNHDRNLRRTRNLGPLGGPGYLGKRGPKGLGPRRKSLSRKSSTEDEYVPSTSPIVQQTTSQLNKKGIYLPPLRESASSLRIPAPCPLKPVTNPTRNAPAEPDTISQTSLGKKIERVRSDEDIRRVQREAEYSKKRAAAEQEDREKFETQDRNHQENCKRLKDDLEYTWKETQRLLSERIRYLEMCREASHQCFLAEKKFIMEEEKWSTYLWSLRDAIKNLKEHFDLFNKIFRQLDATSEDCYQILVSELDTLHKSTQQVNDIIYEECMNTKGLAVRYPDRLFLRILQSRLVKISEKLFEILTRIDYSKQTKKSVDRVIDGFHELKARDIPGTDFLRKMEKNEIPEEYQLMEDPKFYEGPRAWSLDHLDLVSEND